MTKRFSAAIPFTFSVLLAAFAAAGAPEGPVAVGSPVVPTLSRAARDIPEPPTPEHVFGLEMKRRSDYGFVAPKYDAKPHGEPLLLLGGESIGPAISAFGTTIQNFGGAPSPSSPPDNTGDVGLSHFVQGMNGTGAFSNSAVRVFNKTGSVLSTFQMDSLASGAPCNSGYCDPIVLYDDMANRWLISEFSSTGGNLCVYVSQTADPTGAWYAYPFTGVESGTPDYPKYGVWPQNGNAGSYFVGINAGVSGKRDVVALDRAKMLAGLPATWQKFQVNAMPSSGFQLVLPAGFEGKTPPANGTPAIVVRPRDDEAQDGASTAASDLLEMWAISVDWTTPANSTITQLANVPIADYDMSMCGLGTTWNCMPQPGTTQKIDPIREPIHFPLQYRNFGSYQTIVGCFVEDVDGTDHAALRWFEIRKDAGAWYLKQEGVVGGDAQSRSIGSAAMDSSGNIAIGYTRTGPTAPNYPSMYYKGRQSTDTLGTMPYGEYAIQDAVNSKTDNERYGDYAGIGVDPSDDCTFWFTSEYGGSGLTKIASFKFDQCGCPVIPAAPVATINVPTTNRIDVSWNDSATATITRYYVFRATVSGGPYTQIATVTDTSPGVGGGAGYTYQDTTVSGGTTYYYVIRSNDGAACTSPASNQVSATATGTCTLAPTFAGLTSVTNPGAATCTLNLAWSAGTAACAGPLRYNVYRSTSTGFVPGAGNLIVSNVNATTYADLDNLVSGTTYYYVVRAVDTSNSVEETNTAERSGIPLGPVSTSTITETFETAGGFDNAGWTHQALSGAVDFVWSTAGNPHDGTHDWFSASQTSAAHRVLVSPSFGVVAGTTLSFWHTYAFEGTTTCYDGGTLEISTDGGTNWGVVPDAAFTAGLFNGTITAGSNPINGKRAWCSGTVGAMTNVAVNLSSYAGQPAKLRWHAGEDSSTAATGWYVDSVVLANAGTASACSTGSACANNPTTVDVTPGGPLTLCAGASQLLTANRTGGTGPFTYQWFDGGSPIGGANASTYTAASTGTHSYNCRITGSGCPSGVSDGLATQITWQTGPTFAGLSTVTNSQNATCRLDLAWSAASSGCNPVTYRIYRSTTNGFVPGVANRIASGVSGTSYQDSSGLSNGVTYYYVVRAVDGVGSEETNTTQKSGVPTGTTSITTVFNETFETATPPALPAGWAKVDVTNTTGDWATSTGTVNPSGVAAHGGTKLGYFNSYTATATHSTRLYRTSGASLVGSTAASVSLWVYHETGYPADDDRIQLQVSTNGGAAWVNVGTPISRYTGSTGWAQHTVDFSAYVGQADVRVALLGISQFGNDVHVDDVVFDKTTAVSCTTGGAPNPKEASATGAPMGATKSSGTSVGVSFAAACGATDHAVYWGTGPISGAVSWGNVACSRGLGPSATFDPGTPAGSGFFYFVIVGQTATAEGSYGQAYPAAEIPEGNNAGWSCNRTQNLAGVCP